MINKYEYGIELVIGDIKLLYEYDQPYILFTDIPEEAGVVEFSKGRSYADFVYQYVGDNDWAREFIMEIAKVRNNIK